VNDQVSHPYKITGKISVLCTLICILDSKWEDKSELNGSRHSALRSFTHTIFIC
jgi:hypothetical protein